MTATSVVFHLESGQKLEVLAALALYREDLEKLATKAEDLGKHEQARHWNAEASAIEKELTPRIREQGGELLAKEFLIIRSALKRLIKRQLKLAGNLELIYEPGMATTLKAKAQSIEEVTLAQFEEQIRLELGTAIEDPKPTKRGKGLKAIAEAEAKKTEMEVETEGLNRMGGIRDGDTPAKPRKKGRK